MPSLAEWAAAFALTQAIEAPLYYLATRSWRTALLASVWTHPALWLSFRPLEAALGYGPAWGLLELGVVAVESVWLWRRGEPRPLLLSALVNGASALTGLGLQRAWGWP